jgi:hypothetical protein
MHAGQTLELGIRGILERELARALHQVAHEGGDEDLGTTRLPRERASSARSTTTLACSIGAASGEP